MDNLEAYQGNLLELRADEYADSKISCMGESLVDVLKFLAMG